MKNTLIIHKRGAGVKGGSLAFLLLVVAVVVVLLLAACQTKGQSGGDPGVTATAGPSGSSNSGELTMAVWHYYDKHLKDAAKLYEEKTGIIVNIQNNWIEPEFKDIEIVDSNGDSKIFRITFGPDMSLDEQKTISALTTGSGADIYDVCFLDFEHLGRNGLLVDMGEWLENDAEFSDDKVFRNILLSGKTESGVFAVPIDFGFSKLYAFTKDEPLPPNKRMTWQEFMDEVSELDYTGEIAYSSTDLDIFMDRFVSRASYFIDEAGNTQSLYSKEMISLLEECRDWSDLGLCAQYGDFATGAASPSYAGMQCFDYTAEFFCTLPEEYIRNSIYFAPIVSDRDVVKAEEKKLYPEDSIGRILYSVNAGSPKAEMAQDFLRFLLSEEAQDEMIDKKSGWFKERKGLGLPINRAVFRGMIERDLERIQKDFDLSTYTIELDFLELISEAEETVDQVDQVDEVAYFIRGNPKCITIIKEAAKEFFLDKITAEEAARRMSDRVGLYLKEQN
jgi:multiple sugar transport system substrate-binding protein